MHRMQSIDFELKRIAMACLILAGMMLVNCSSAPDPQPEPSKNEVQQDADRFFDKIQEEEHQSPYSD